MRSSILNSESWRGRELGGLRSRPVGEKPIRSEFKIEKSELRIEDYFLGTSDPSLIQCS